MSHPPPAKPPCAIVIDDNPIILLSIVDYLHDAGFSVLTAGDGNGALAVLEANGDDTVLLIVDVELPGSHNGLAIAHFAADRWPTIAIVVYSGQVKPKLVELPEAAVFLELPFSMTDLLFGVRDTLASKHPALLASGALTFR